MKVTPPNLRLNESYPPNLGPLESKQQVIPKSMFPNSSRGGGGRGGGDKKVQSSQIYIWDKFPNTFFVISPKVGLR